MTQLFDAQGNALEAVRKRQRPTPGPWRWRGNTLEPETKDPDRSAVFSILDRDGGYGFLGSKPGDTTLELGADYALIAAAPELLKALKVLVENANALSSAIRDANDFGRGDVLSRRQTTDIAIEIARAALARVPGDAA